MSATSHPRHDVPSDIDAFADLVRYENLAALSGAAVLGHVLVILVADLLLVASSLLLIATLGAHAWHRREAYRQLRRPGSVGTDRALWAQLTHGMTVAIAGPCAMLFLAAEVLVGLFG